MPSKDFIPAIEDFYQNNFNRYLLIPSLTIPVGMEFGPQYTSNGKTTILNVFGPLGVQQFHDRSHLDMGFSGKSDYWN